jgi:hypothetical protein
MYLKATSRSLLLAMLLLAMLLVLRPMPLLQPGWAGIGTAQAFQALETFSLETCSLIKAE